MKTLKVIGLLFMLVMLLTGCPRPYAYIVYNNTSSDLFVVLEDKEIEWKSRSLIIIDDDLGKKCYEDTGEAIYPMIAFRHGDKIFSFRMSSGYIPREYYGDLTSGITTT